MLNFEVLDDIVGHTVQRPNQIGRGTLSGHAAGEPFEKLVYSKLKEKYPNNIFKQYEYLNDLYLKNPKSITKQQRDSLFESPTVLFLLSRGEQATKAWNPDNVFEEKQNDTADILYTEGDSFTIIDVKTHNVSKNAQAPNIISAYKLARTCALIIDNNEMDNLAINYVGINWEESGECLKCNEYKVVDLFKSNPETLYINWAAALQIQFHVHELDQSFMGTMLDWSRDYLRVFVDSAKRRCDKMVETYIKPFEKYIL